MHFFVGITLASIFIAAQACTMCPHPGAFKGNLTLLAEPDQAYCGLEDTLPNSIYASVPAAFYDPPDESPCDAPINVTNPTTKKSIKAIVVGKCTACAGDSIRLTRAGLLALSPNGKAGKAPSKVTWTFE